MESTQIKYMDLPTPASRSVSPSISSETNLGFFHILCKRLKNQTSNEDLDTHSFDNDSSSYSIEDSYSSGKVKKLRNFDASSEVSDDSNYGSTRNVRVNFKEALEDDEIKRSRNRSLSSLGRLFKNISLKSLSRTDSKTQSCQNTPTKKNKKEKKRYVKTPPPQQRILRRPVDYVYVKGLSGLATQRVPRSAVCCHYSR